VNIILTGSTGVWHNVQFGTLRRAIGEIMKLIQVRLKGVDADVGIELRQKRRGMLAHASHRHGNIESREEPFL
jgi:hypothetical protein